MTALFHADGGSRPRICCLGFTVMVRDQFLNELKTPPHFWIGPEMIRRIVKGESPFLSSKEIREANSRDGLNLVCWIIWVRPGYEVRPLHVPRIYRETSGVFLEGAYQLTGP